MSVMLLATLFLAATSPDVCAQSTNTFALLECLNAAYRKADRELNAAWPRILAAARASDHASTATIAKPQAEANLTAAQRRWIDYRNAQCVAESDSAAGGSLQNVIEIDCLLRLTRERIQTLSKMHDAY